MPDSGMKALVAEIRLLLQQELGEVRDSMNDIRLEIADFKGKAVSRDEFSQAFNALQAKREIAEAMANEKREKLEERVGAQERQMTEMKTTMKIYVGMAGAIAGVVGSGVGAVLFGLIFGAG